MDDADVMIDSNLQVLIDRVRNGDPGAREEFVLAYGPYVRNCARRRLRERRISPARLGASLSDICQSVFRHFLRKWNGREIAFTTHEEARRHLAVWVRDRVAAQARRRRLPRPPQGEADVDRIATDVDPAGPAIDRDELGRVRPLVSAEEYELLSMHFHGFRWAEVAAKLGGTAEARSKQAERLLKRVRDRLKGRDSSS